MAKKQVHPVEDYLARRMSAPQMMAFESLVRSHPMQWEELVANAGYQLAMEQALSVLLRPDQVPDAAMQVGGFSDPPAEIFETGFNGDLESLIQPAEPPPVGFPAELLPFAADTELAFPENVHMNAAADLVAMEAPNALEAPTLLNENPSSSLIPDASSITTEGGHKARPYNDPSSLISEASSITTEGGHKARPYNDPSSLIPDASSITTEGGHKARPYNAALPDLTGEVTEGDDAFAASRRHAPIQAGNELAADLGAVTSVESQNDRIWMALESAALEQAAPPEMPIDPGGRPQATQLEETDPLAALAAKMALSTYQNGSRPATPKSPPWFIIQASPIPRNSILSTALGSWANLPASRGVGVSIAIHALAMFALTFAIEYRKLPVMPPPEHRHHHTEEFRITFAPVKPRVDVAPPLALKAVIQEQSASQIPPPLPAANTAQAKSPPPPPPKTDASQGRSEEPTPLFHPSLTAQALERSDAISITRMASSPTGGAVSTFAAPTGAGGKNEPPDRGGSSARKLVAGIEGGPRKPSVKEPGVALDAGHRTGIDLPHGGAKEGSPAPDGAGRASSGGIPRLTQGQPRATGLPGQGSGPGPRTMDSWAALLPQGLRLMGIPGLDVRPGTTASQLEQALAYSSAGEDSGIPGAVPTSGSGTPSVLPAAGRNSGRLAKLTGIPKSREIPTTPLGRHQSGGEGRSRDVEAHRGRSQPVHAAVKMASVPNAERSTQVKAPHDPNAVPKNAFGLRTGNGQAAGNGGAPASGSYGNPAEAIRSSHGQKETGGAGDEQGAATFAGTPNPGHTTIPDDTAAEASQEPIEAVDPTRSSSTEPADHDADNSDSGAGKRHGSGRGSGDSRRTDAVEMALIHLEGDPGASSNHPSEGEQPSTFTNPGHGGGQNGGRGQDSEGSDEMSGIDSQPHRDLRPAGPHTGDKGGTNRGGNGNNGTHGWKSHNRSSPGYYDPADRLAMAPPGIPGQISSANSGGSNSPDAPPLRENAIHRESSGTSPADGGSEPPLSGEYELPRLVLDSGSNFEAISKLLQEVGKHTHLRVKLQAKPVDLLQHIPNGPLLILSGTHPLQISDTHQFAAQKLALRQFVEGGGLIWVDGKNSEFARSCSEVLKSMFGEATPLALSHDVYDETQNKGYNLSNVPAGSNGRSDLFEGFFVSAQPDSPIAAIITPGEYLLAITGSAHRSETVAKDALKVGVNICLFATSQFQEVNGK